MKSDLHVGDPVSPAILDAVEAVLPLAGGLKPKDVHARVGRWAPVTIRHALRQLVAAGRAAYDGRDGRRLYRRVE